MSVLVLVAALCLAALLPPAGVATVPTSPGMKGRAADCTTRASLAPRSPSSIRYVVWCGAQTGRVTLRIRRPHGSALTGFSATAEAVGPGAAGPLRCHSQAGGRVFCAGRTRGPVTYRGSVTVSPGTRCGGKLSLNVWRWTGDALTFPAGCPHHYEEAERGIGQIVRERASYGLDRDLAGDHASIIRRARALQAAWRHGNPVARWTSLEEAFGMPLRAGEQVELEYRETYRRHFQHVIEDTDWVATNAPSSYAGYQIDEAAGGIIYVGFTAEPEAMLDRLKRRLIAPSRFKPFPVTPTYSVAELDKIWSSFPPRDSAMERLVDMTTIDYLANKIWVATEHAARLRRLIAERYGPEAPFEVVFGRAPVFL